MKSIQIACALLAAFTLSADTLYLRDGRTVRGTFISGNSREVRFLEDGGRTQRHSISAVDRIAFGDDSRSSVNNDPRSGVSRRDYPAASSDGSRDRAANSAYSVPAGTVVTVRMIDSIDSDQTDVGRRYRASLDEPLVVNGQTIAPRGADATVEVVRVEQSGTIKGREEVGLALTSISANGRALATRTEDAVVSAKSRSNESVKVIGGTAVVGAIIGAIAGGGKGAAIGAASGAGAGAAIQAIRGQRIQVPSESRLDFTLAEPMRY